MDTSALSTANALSAANAIGVPTPALPGALNELKEAVIDTAEKAASPIAKSLSITPDGVEKKPAEAHADAALDQANATVESAVVSGTAAEKIAAKSAELVCAELRKNAANIWQQAANAIIDHLDTPEVMGKFSNSISEVAIKYMPTSLTDAIVKDSGVAAAMIVEVINSISKLKGDTWRYEKDINKYTLGKLANSFRGKKDTSETSVPVADGSTASVEQVPVQGKVVGQLPVQVQGTVLGVTPPSALANAQPTVSVPLENGLKQQAEAAATTATTAVAAAATATPAAAAGGSKNTSSYKGGAIYSFEPELRFIRAMARKSRKFNLKTRSTKKNKRKSRRLRK
jgi:hypothetical protein